MVPKAPPWALMSAYWVMTGTKLAPVCLRFGVPFAQLRAVSNPIGYRARDRWDLPTALTALDQALRDICAGVA